MTEEDFSRRLGTIEARFEERWNAHDKRSEDTWRDIREHMLYSREKLSGLACKEHSTRLELIRERVHDGLNTTSRRLGLIEKTFYGFLVALVVAIIGWAQVTYR